MTNQPNLETALFTPGQLLLLLDHPPNLALQEIVDSLRESPLLRESWRGRELLERLGQQASGEDYESYYSSINSWLEDGRLQQALFDALDVLTVEDLLPLAGQEQESSESESSQSAPPPAAEGGEGELRGRGLTSARLLLNGLLTDPAADLLLLYLSGDLSLTLQENPQRGPVHIQAASPNWLFGGTPSNIITGGPGGLPVPPQQVQQGLPVQEEDYSFSPQDLPSQAGQENAQAKARLQAAFAKGKNLNPMVGAQQQQQQQQSPQALKVFILDTLHSAMAWEAPLAQWGKDSANPHPLVQRLLPPAPSQPPRFHPHYYLYADAEWQGHRHQDDDYNQADHGTFIAGMIDSLAPEAALHIVQVLNDHGVGDLLSLLWGVGEILRESSRQELLLVNCSLMLTAPSDSENHPNLPGPTGSLLRDMLALLTPEQAYALLHVLFRVLQQQRPNAIIIAAAGNDSEAPIRMAAPRYPAAIGGVIGVGAINRDLSPARYSNLADYPSEEGFVAFGGEANFHEASSRDGVLGMYLAPQYPDGTPNESGWAAWAGTSFACALVTGTLARLITLGEQRNNARTLLKEVCTEVRNPPPPFQRAHLLPMLRRGQRFEAPSP